MRATEDRQKNIDISLSYDSVFNIDKEVLI